VGFRFFTIRAAHRIGNIYGYVRNMPDGTVQVYAEADEASMSLLVEELKKGPSLGRVDEVLIEEEEPTGRYATFDVAF
jgi:acylphosphatase